MVGASTPGSTYVLTSGNDNLTGTDLADTFIANTAGNLSGDDIIDGGLGTDILEAVATSGSIRPILANVETVRFILSESANAAATHTYNFDRSTGVKTVEFENFAHGTGGSDTMVANVTTDTILKVTDKVGGSATTRDNNYTITYDNVAGTSDSATVELSTTTADYTIGNITVANIEDLTVNASGGFDTSYKLVAAAATSVSLTSAADSAATDTTAGTVTLAAGEATTVTATASNDLTIADDAASGMGKVTTFNVVSNDADSTITINDVLTTNAAKTTETLTFNVSGVGKADLKSATSWTGNNTGVAEDKVVVLGSSSTGDITYTTNTAAANLVTTGSGNDNVVLSGILDADDSINLGAGTADKISVVGDYTGVNSIDDLFFDSDDSDTSDDPTITGVEIASVTIADSGAATTTDVASASFASTLELLGDADDAAAKITGITAGQTIKLGKTLDLTHDDSSLVLTTSGATSTAPSESLTLLQIFSRTLVLLPRLSFTILISIQLRPYLSLESSDTTVVKVLIDEFSADKASNVTVTSSENVTVGTIDAADDATLDFTGVTGTLAVTVDTTNDYTVKGSAAAASTITMGTGLDADDIIQAGSATTDKLTATANGLTATTGKLSISGVDEILLTTVTAASTFDASGITGASIIRFNGAATANSSNTVDTTLTNLAAGTVLVSVVMTTQQVGVQPPYPCRFFWPSDKLDFELGDVNEDDDIGGSIKALVLRPSSLMIPIPQRTLSLMSWWLPQLSKLLEARRVKL